MESSEKWSRLGHHFLDISPHLENLGLFSLANWRPIGDKWSSFGYPHLRVHVSGEWCTGKVQPSVKALDGFYESPPFSLNQGSGHPLTKSSTQPKQWVSFLTRRFRTGVHQKTPTSMHYFPWDMGDQQETVKFKVSHRG